MFFRVWYETPQHRKKFVLVESENFDHVKKKFEQQLGTSLISIEAMLRKNFFITVQSTEPEK